MESNRDYPINYVKSKPTIIFDKRFKFANDLQIGDKGQLEVILKTESIRLTENEDGTESNKLDFEVKKAEIIAVKGARE